MAEAAMTAIEVVYDSGRGVPVSPYLAWLVSADSAEGDPVPPGLRFPIRSRLSPGLLDRERPVFDPLWLTQPVFVAGADAASLRWLAFNRLRLLRAGAWGLAARARDELDFRAIQSVAADLKLAPSVGDWLDERLLAAGIAVYPLLIGLDGIARQILPAALYGEADAPFAQRFAAPVTPAARPDGEGQP